MRRNALLAVLASGLMLAACSSASQAVPGQPTGTAPASRHLAMHTVALVPTAKNHCPSSKFLFCVTISPTGSGPYWYECGNASCAGSQYDLVGTSTITMTRSGKNMDRQLPSSFSPSPGNPTGAYVSEHKPFTPGANPKFTQTSSFCYYYSPSVCGSPIVIGLIPG